MLSRYPIRNDLPVFKSMLTDSSSAGWGFSKNWG